MHKRKRGGLCVNVNYYGWPKECKANRGKKEKKKKTLTPKP
jgi:hypothetical protein